MKQGIPYAIRPFPFHKTPEKAFSNIHEFVEAIYETRKIFMQNGMIDPNEWKSVVKNFDQNYIMEK